MALEAVFENVRDYFDEKIMNDMARKVATYEHSNDYKQFFSKDFAVFYNSLSLLKSKITDIKDLFEDIEDPSYLPGDIEIGKDLLDYYKAQFEENFNDITRQTETIDNLIKISQLYVSHIRNRMARFSIFLEIVFIAFLIPNLVLSSFGMNVPNIFEESERFFGLLWLILLFFATIIYIIISRLFIKFVD